MSEDTVTLNVVDEPKTFSFVGQRLEGESFADYKERQKTIKTKQEQNAKGTLFWDSRNRGTYIKAKHANVGEQ